MENDYGDYFHESRWFTATEAAALTRLSLQTVNNAIDKRLVPTAEVARGDPGVVCA